MRLYLSQCFLSHFQSKQPQSRNANLRVVGLQMKDVKSRDLLDLRKYVELIDTGHFSLLEAPEKAESIIKPRRQISERSLTLDNCHHFFVNL